MDILEAAKPLTEMLARTLPKDRMGVVWAFVTNLEATIRETEKRQEECKHGFDLPGGDVSRHKTAYCPDCGKDLRADKPSEEGKDEPRNRSVEERT